MRRILKTYFVSGLAVFVPLALAVYVFVWIMNFAESLLGKYIKPLFLEYYDFYFWGMGIIILVVVILLCGFIVAQYLGKVVHQVAERMLVRVPILGTIYPAFKEISRFLFREHAAGIQKVVMIQWPRPGVYAIAFLTSRVSENIAVAAGRPLCNVMIPTVPNPLTGFVVMVPEEEITPLPISIEDAVKIIVSGGVINGTDPLKPEPPDGPLAV